MTKTLTSTTDSIVVTGLVNCARCKGTHEEPMNFTRLEHPFVEGDGTAYTHWCPCPVNGQPVMLTREARQTFNVQEPCRACDASIFEKCGRCAIRQALAADWPVSNTARFEAAVDRVLAMVLHSPLKAKEEDGAV